MRNYSTVNDIKTEVAALYKNLTGRPALTAVEQDIVAGAIVDAYQIVLLEYGVSNFRFQEAEVSLSIEAGVPYVDLEPYIYRVLQGTVRIPARSILLNLIEEKAVFLSDPELKQTGVPTAYWYSTHPTDVNILRLGLWPTPDAQYSMLAKVYKYPSDSIQNFPSYLNTAIKFKAKALACLGLGLGAAKPGFDAAYEDIIAKIKDGYDSEEPKHIPIRRAYWMGGCSESRIPE